jgi:hypothetical protein
MYVIHQIINMFKNIDKKSLMNKTRAINNYNYNKSLLYMIPEILRYIIIYTNDLSTTRTLYCTSKIFQPLLSKLKTMKYISHYNKHNAIDIYPLLPCFKSAHHIMFIHFYFSKHVILQDFGHYATNNVVCDVLLSKQYHQLSFVDCHIKPYIIDHISKNKSLKNLTLIRVQNFCDKSIFNCFLQHDTLNEIYIAHTPFSLKMLNREHIEYILRVTNHFTNKYCQYLCQLFKKSKLTKISLINCGITDVYFLLYMTFLLNTNINYIDFSYNLITKDYHHFIYNCFYHCSNNVTINLTHNPIKDKYINMWKQANDKMTILF